MDMITTKKKEGVVIVYFDVNISIVQTIFHHFH